MQCIILSRWSTKTSRGCHTLKLTRKLITACDNTSNSLKIACAGLYFPSLPDFMLHVMAILSYQALSGPTMQISSNNILINGANCSAMYPNLQTA